MTGNFRGPLRYEVETSIAQLEAGRKFTVFLRVTNPYDVPVTLISVDSRIPVEFRDVSLVRSAWESFRDEVAAEASAEADARVTVAESLTPVSTDGQKETALILQPGNSALYPFTLRTRREVLFTPSLYTLHLQVRYEMDEVANFDTVKHQINVRAPLKALMWGAMLGSVAGTGLRVLVDAGEAGKDPLVTFLPFFEGAILAALVVVAFARRRDVQSFIAIEDFWGGVFAGFVAAYVGTPILGDIVPGSIQS